MERNRLYNPVREASYSISESMTLVEAILPLHIVGMKFDLSRLPDDVISVSWFGEEAAGVMQFDVVPQVDTTSPWRNCPDIPTGYVDDTVVIQCLSNGTDQFILRPDFQQSS
jgi:hypothetical protein